MTTHGYKDEWLKFEKEFFLLQLKDLQKVDMQEEVIQVIKLAKVPGTDEVLKKRLFSRMYCLVDSKLFYRAPQSSNPKVIRSL